jgi:hypothetical protein
MPIDVHFNSTKLTYTEKGCMHVVQDSILLLILTLNIWLKLWQNTLIIYIIRLNPLQITYVFVIGLMILQLAAMGVLRQLLLRIITASPLMDP